MQTVPYRSYETCHASGRLRIGRDGSWGNVPDETGGWGPGEVCGGLVTPLKRVALEREALHDAASHGRRDIRWRRRTVACVADAAYGTSVNSRRDRNINGTGSFE